MSFNFMVAVTIHSDFEVQEKKLSLLSLFTSLFAMNGHGKWDFPDGSVGKESACNSGGMGDIGSIPGLGRSRGGGKW